MDVDEAGRQHPPAPVDPVELRKSRRHCRECADIGDAPLIDHDQRIVDALHRVIGQKPQQRGTVSLHQVLGSFPCTPWTYQSMRLSASSAMLPASWRTLPSLSSSRPENG